MSWLMPTKKSWLFKMFYQRNAVRKDRLLELENRCSRSQKADGAIIMIIIIIIIIILDMFFPANHLA